jgi:hypothetical protein
MYGRLATTNTKIDNIMNNRLYFVNAGKSFPNFLLLSNFGDNMSYNKATIDETNNPKLSKRKMTSIIIRKILLLFY